MKKRELNLGYNIRIMMISFLSILILTSCTLEKVEIQQVEEDVIALVNGEKLYIEEFNQFYEIINAAGIYKEPNESKTFALNLLIGDKVQEQKIIELGITASDNEAMEIYNEAFENQDSSFEEFLEKSTVLEVNDYFNSAKEGIKIDKLYEMNTKIEEGSSKPGGAIEVRRDYLNLLVKEAKIGVNEEYFDLVPKDFEVDKLKVIK